MTEARSLGTVAFPIGAMRPTVSGHVRRNLSTYDGAKSAAQMNAEQAAARDAQPLTARCAHCPEWIFDGPAGDARAAWVDHVMAAHPGVRLKKSRLTDRSAREVQRDEAMLLVAERAARRAAA